MLNQSLSTVSTERGSPFRVLRRWSPDVASATADLPVQQASKIEMFLNLKTARALGITIPLPLSGRADEIFE
jgi:hypothetical protein